ncbi:MAG: hypothetical protein ACLRXC_12640 [[Clostridium] leptum]
MKTYNVGIVGATGMVGRFATLLETILGFRKVLASPRSAGKTYEEAVGNRWAMDVPAAMKDMDASKVEDVAKGGLFLRRRHAQKAEIKALEEAYAKANARWTKQRPSRPGCPHDHSGIGPGRGNPSRFSVTLGTSGFISVKSNCSLQAMFPLFPLSSWESARRWFGLSAFRRRKDLASWPEMVDMIPWWRRENRTKPLKIWGNIQNVRLSPPRLRLSRRSACVCRFQHFAAVYWL